MKNNSILNNFIIFFKKEFESIGLFEKFLYIFSILSIVFVSIYLKDSKIAVLGAFFGITYTIFAGEGKIYCYLFGILSSLIYSYLAFKNGFYGNFALNMFYYFPVQIAGIFIWKKNLKKNSLEIIKTKLQIKNTAVIFIAAFALSLSAGFVLNKIGNLGYLDGICLVFSIFAMLLTVKRCIEQWYFWIIVNSTASIMWFLAFLNGSNCFATVIMWIIYLILGFYFLAKWKKELFF